MAYVISIGHLVPRNPHALSVLIGLLKNGQPLLVTLLDLQ